jgi:CHAT domain-containing protein
MLAQKSLGSSRPRLHWCPTGAFMFLPLHAAGIYGTIRAECCADYVVSSYTPTLAALLRAQKSNSSFRRQEARLCLIAVMKAHDVNLPTLWNVEAEVGYLRDTAKDAGACINDSSSCIGDAATIKQVVEVFQSTNLAHIACHGIQDGTNALASGFCLSDGNLTVSRLMDLDLRDAFFAFLSACETAKGDEKQPDQTVHLAAAMLFVGFSSVVATMW